MEEVTCGFCGKRQSEVKKLIRGPIVPICDECVGLCNDIVAEERDAESAAQEVDASHTDQPMLVDTMTLVHPDGMEVPTIFEVFAPVANGDAGSACRLRIQGDVTIDRSIAGGGPLQALSLALAFVYQHLERLQAQGWRMDPDIDAEGYLEAIFARGSVELPD